VPDGYTSNTRLTTSSTYTGATLASLGVTPGTYVWSWGSGATADSLTLQICNNDDTGVRAGFETLLFTGLAGIGAPRWRQRRRR